LESLSDREIKIVRLIVEGKSTSEIAEELGYAIQTVRNYLCEIYGKTKTNNRVSLAMLAVKRGWTDPNGQNE
jgi:DNA-binding NarL/FixJ family response regulator